MIRRGLITFGVCLAALAVVASGLLPGIRIEGQIGLPLIVAGAVLALLNALVRPLLRLFPCALVPVVLIAGLLTLNALMLLLAALVSGWLAPSTGGRLVVEGFGWALAGGAIIAVVITAFSALLDRQPVRVPVPAAPDVRQIADSQRAQLDQQFDSLVQPPREPPT